MKLTFCIALSVLVGVSAAAAFDTTIFGIASDANTFNLDRCEGIQHYSPKQPTPFGVSAGLRFVKNNGYLVNLTFANTVVEMIIDTGSSGTWTITNETISPSSPVPDAILNITYGDGTNIFGSYLKTDVSLGDSNLATSQIVGIGTNLTVPAPDLFGSLKGIFGLMGFPSSAEYQVPNGTWIEYDPLFATLMKQHPETKQFSMALDSKGGTLAFGGLPRSITPLIDGAFAEVPIIPTNGKLSFYRADVAFAFEGADKIPGIGGQDDTNHFQGLIDCGTSNDWVPTSVANAVGALYSPPAAVIEQSGFAFQKVFCNATAPTFGIKFGGQVFDYPAEEMFMQSDAEGICWSSIVGQPLPTGLDGMIISQSFMRQVVAVFDLEKASMSFAKKKKV